MNKIPKDKWDEVFDELRVSVQQISGVIDIIKITADSMSIDASEALNFPDEITWINDGKSENTIQFSNGENGDKQGEIKFGLKND